jgi:hypothetical protein
MAKRGVGKKCAKWVIEVVKEEEEGKDPVIWVVDLKGFYPDER